MQLRNQLINAEEDNQSLTEKLASAEREVARFTQSPSQAEGTVKDTEVSKEQAAIIDRLQKNVAVLEATVRHQAEGQRNEKFAAPLEGILWGSRCPDALPDTVATAEVRTAQEAATVRSNRALLRVPLAHDTCFTMFAKLHLRNTHSWRRSVRRCARAATGL